ncbi:MarR family winged helix-turn-helix transcriptional regulator [Dermacoccaceae bacterium W4C1]
MSDDGTDRLLRSVARLNRWATRHADLELPPAQGRILGLLAELGTSRIGDLAIADHCSQPTMTTQVKRLESMELVTRRSDPEDARAWLVEVTPQGSAALARMREARSAAVQERLDGLSSRDRQVLDEAAAIMVRMVQTD